MLELLKNVNIVYVISFLFALDQALAEIPAVKSNSTFQLISNVLGWLKDKIVPKSESKE